MPVPACAARSRHASPLLCPITLCFCTSQGPLHFLGQLALLLHISRPAEGALNESGTWCRSVSACAGLLVCGAGVLVYPLVVPVVCASLSVASMMQVRPTALCCW